MNDSLEAKPKITDIIKKIVKSRRFSLILFFIIPILTFYFTQGILHETLFYIDFQLQIVNWLYCILVACFFTALFGRARAGLWTTELLFWLYAMINAYLYEFRGTYIMPWDVITIRTAFNVAGNYNYKPTDQMVIGTILMVALAVLTWFCRLSKPFKTLVKRFGALVLSVVLFVGLTVFVQRVDIPDVFHVHNSTFSINTVTTKNGMLLGFLFKMKYLNAEKPDGYEKGAVKELLEAVSTEEAENELPDIVVVMNEAYSDPAVDVPVEAEEDYMPFTHSLQAESANAISGCINVSVLGGKTPNTEFEFLTGHSMGFLPEGCVPFQQYVRKNMDSIPWYLQSLGYHTVGAHPYDGTGWDRDMVYGFLGFQDIWFKDHFKETGYYEKIRKFVSDESVFGDIRHTLENLKDPDKPAFLFYVTMQNHSGYKMIYDNFEPFIKLKGIDSESEAGQELCHYLSLIRKSDDALKEFTEYLQASRRKTVVVMFGDHQPNTAVFRALYEAEGKDYENLSEEDMENIYRVPFVIWANFDIPKEHGIETSVNYLGNLVLKASGVPLTRYRKFTDDFSENYPVISAIRVVDKEGRSSEVSEALPKLNEYAKLEYYEIFDDTDEFP